MHRWVFVSLGFERFYRPSASVRDKQAGPPQAAKQDADPEPAVPVVDGQDERALRTNPITISHARSVLPVTSDRADAEAAAEPKPDEKGSAADISGGQTDGQPELSAAGDETAEALVPRTTFDVSLLEQPIAAHDEVAPVEPAQVSQVMAQNDVVLVQDEAVPVENEEMPEFPVQELSLGYQARGPVVHIEAIQAMAHARGRRPRLKRRGLPPGSFETLVTAGLIDEHGRLSDDGLRVAEVIRTASLRVRVHAAASEIPLIFEAHIFDGQALIFATDAPAEFLTRHSEGVQAAADDPKSRITLDLERLDLLPLSMAAWAGIQPSDSVPERRDFTVSWGVVEARFQAAEPSWPGATEVWEQAWCGWAISTDPATQTLKMVQAGRHSFRLTRLNEDTAHLVWVSPQSVWADIVGMVQRAISS